MKFLVATISFIFLIWNFSREAFLAPLSPQWPFDPFVSLILPIPTYYDYMITQWDSLRGITLSCQSVYSFTAGTKY